MTHQPSVQPALAFSDVGELVDALATDHPLGLAEVGERQRGSTSQPGPVPAIVLLVTTGTVAPHLPTSYRGYPVLLLPIEDSRA